MNVMEFLAMGGHGPYIWGSYGVMALLMAIEARQVIARKRRALRPAPIAPHRGGLS